MGRRIVTKQYQGGGTATTDGYFDKVIKYIPSDIVAAWTGVLSFLDVDKEFTALWIAFVIGLVLTYFWTIKQTSEENKPPAINQALISTGAFGIWVCALGGPFKSISGYETKYGALLLILYTLILGFLDPNNDKSPNKKSS
jgi:uncharacterized membrane protein YfcA